jgi:hypothetical protein
MASVEDVEQVIGALPEVTQGLRFGYRTWFVAGKPFAWERPRSKADLRRFGPQAAGRADPGAERGGD